ncbi:MAG: redox-regulated ATPase YchF [Deltaproteobacteria bacterium]|nr:redox-regulated ATPase YchF [Deltaproteobacteria bacterium]
MRIGLLGFEQSGKRTLLALLTGRRVPEGRKPHEALEGVAPIRDPRVDVLAGICSPERVKYADNHFVLCPDVVVGADAAGGPTRREWVAAARGCELLCLVVRAFKSGEIYHPCGSVDPGRDQRALEAELLLADMILAEQRLERLGREAKSGLGAEQVREQAALAKLMRALEAERIGAALGLGQDELGSLRHLGLLCLVPRLVVQNVGEKDVARDLGAGVFAVSARVEREIAELADPAERAVYLATLGLAASGLERMNAAAYEALGLMSYYTIGSDEVRAWTIRAGAHAADAGGKIHSDIERGFIRVEVIKYGDLVAAGTEKAARERGKMQTRGRDYRIEDGDICHFLFHVEHYCRKLRFRVSRSPLRGVQ